MRLKAMKEKKITKAESWLKSGEAISAVNGGIRHQ
jgi:hypothetical protein